MRAAQGLIKHVDNVWFNEAPLPRRLHFCKPHTTVAYLDGSIFARCACGAQGMQLRTDHKVFWLEGKNSRRRYDKRMKKEGKNA